MIGVVEKNKKTLVVDEKRKNGALQTKLHLYKKEESVCGALHTVWDGLSQDSRQEVEEDVGEQIAMR